MKGPAGAGSAASTGRYRLAVLAERFGADAQLVDLSAEQGKTSWPALPSLPARLLDPRPPDLPAAAGKRLRVINGGKA